MKKFPNLRAVYCNNDTMAMGVVEAVKGKNKLNQIIVVGNDGTSEALDSIKKGELSATVNIYPYFGGKIALDIALRCVAGQNIPKVVYTNQAIIDQENAHKSAEEVINWKSLEFK
jgi:ribose transport system substrate-binding protein